MKTLIVFAVVVSVISLIVFSYLEIWEQQFHYVELEDFDYRMDYVINEMSCRTIMQNIFENVNDEPYVKIIDGEVWEKNYPSQLKYSINIWNTGFLSFPELDQKVEECKK